MLNLIQHRVMNKKIGYVYILGNVSKTLYIGVTSNLQKRIFLHKNKILKGFTSKYNINKLLYYEEYDTIETAISREKQLKNWHREWKLNLVKSKNPNLVDLYEKILK
jgi:putative endonuclease